MLLPYPTLTRGLTLTPAINHTALTIIGASLMNPANTFSAQKIFKAACILARQHGIASVHKKHIADRLGCAPGTINYHWGTMETLRVVVRTFADAHNDMRIYTGRRR